MLNTTRTTPTGSITYVDANPRQAVDCALRYAFRMKRNGTVEPTAWRIRERSGEVLAFVAIDADGKITTIRAKGAGR